MALGSPDPAVVRKLVKELYAAVGDTGDIGTTDAGKILGLTNDLTHALESPVPAAYTHMLSQNVTSCIKIASDLKIFSALSDAKDQSLTADQLASKSGADPAFVARIMRVLTPLGIAKEVGESTYTSAPKGEAIARPFAQSGLQHTYSSMYQVSLKAPEFFQTNGYKNPSLEKQTPFMYAWDTKDSVFEWMQKRPAVSANFDKLMQGNRQQQKSWVEWFPVKQEVLDGAKQDANSVLIVDQGGGLGHDIVDFRNKIQTPSGRLVLEDQEHVLPNYDLPGIEKLNHDFFKPQPIKGARVYFMHFILHDWDDEKSIEILKNLASAMEKGYSKLYLNEKILPNTGVPISEALADVNMMLLNAGIERTKHNWETLLEKAGLKLVKFWTPTGYGEGIIEAEV